MYEFAILALGGLVVAKTVDLVRHLVRGIDTTGAVILAAAAGVAYAYLFDYSIFAAWGIDVRSDVVGTIATGLFMFGLAGVWRTALRMMREWAHHHHGEASEIEARMHRAA